MTLTCGEYRFINHYILTYCGSSMSETETRVKCEREMHECGGG
jgi:hypothetical protein